MYFEVGNLNFNERGIVKRSVQKYIFKFILQWIVKRWSECIKLNYERRVYALGHKRWNIIFIELHTENAGECEFKTVRLHFSGL